MGADQRDRDHRRTRDAGSYPSMPVDTAEVFSGANDRATERQKRIGGNELWDKKQSNGAWADILGTWLLCQYSRS